MRRNAVGIEKANFKNYNFKLNKISEFILRPEEDQEVKAVFDVYWNQNNLYLQAAVLNGEEVTVSIQEEGARDIIDSQTFYSSSGATFNVRKGRSYRITASENGSYPKIVMMQLSDAVIPSNRTAKSNEMAKVHSRLLVAKIKLEVVLSALRIA